MSTAEAAAPESATESPVGETRRSLSMAERIKLVDWLRVQVEPIVGVTKVEIARKVSDGVGFQVSVPQLDYMVEQLPEWKLGDKLHVKAPETSSMPESIAAMFREHQKQLDAYRGELAAHAKELAELNTAVGTLQVRLGMLVGVVEDLSKHTEGGYAAIVDDIAELR